MGRPRRPDRRRPTAPAGRWLIPVAVAVVAIALDQVVKRVVVAALAGDGPRHHWLAGDWLGFQYVENRGAAFGTFTGLGAILTPLALVIIAVTAWMVSRVQAPSAGLLAGLGLVIGGALGNVIDRIRLGYVVDFVAVGPWPRFNLADSAITVGVLLLVWRLGGTDAGTVADTPSGPPRDARPTDEGRPARPEGSNG